MTHGPEHHIEHAEHAQHAAHDPFDRRVTISIAMVAAVLACVTMLGHRAHNETLRLQGEALQAQTEGGIKHSQAANIWAMFQAKNIRSHMYQAFGELAAAGSAKPNERWDKQVKKYEKDMPGHEEQAKELTKEGEQNQNKSKDLLKESEHAHHKAERFDLGELGLQLGVVLCSLAILTKGKPFWYAGLGCSVAGLLVAVTGILGLFMGH